ncbi:MAG: thiolase family protein, partial [Thermoanaerobacterales bacterium]|nr:thiolase family protein [Thermoanaerobacterales bacterium]
KPVFKENGTVTAGSSSGRNDGASALMLMAAEKAQELGLRPMARIVSQAACGVSPEIMGIGPVPSTQKALQRANLTLDNIDLIELNEAFAAQSLACIKAMGLENSMDKININGGAIALGHPLGASGAIILTKLLHDMVRLGKRYGLATLCIAGGQGVATIVENMNI